MSDSDPVYYKLYLSNRTMKFAVVCMQEFDEPDYDATRWLRVTDNGALSMDQEDRRELRFENKSEAAEFLRAHVRAEYIQDDVEGGEKIMLQTMLIKHND